MTAERSRTTTTTTASAATSATERGLPAVLLARRGSVYLPEAGAAPTTGQQSGQPSGQQAGVALLEADLLERGWLLSAPLRAELTVRSSAALTAVGRALLAEIDRALGADRPHLPLFRDFPHSIPQDTSAFYVDRVLSVLFQAPEQPCVLCGKQGSVHAVAPCAHLVCHSCFDGADFSACPICHRRIDLDDPFLKPQRPRRRAVDRGGLPVRLRVLGYGGDGAAVAEAADSELRGLLARTGALSPQDGDDLMALLHARSRGDLSFLPLGIPGRETKAWVLAWLLRTPDPAALAAAAERLGTATDVLRLLAVRSGGDAGLLEVPRLTTLPRPLRRMLLGVLDRSDPATAVQEMRRRRRLWIHAAELLHPFEQVARHPRAALAFAALRGTPLGEDRLSAALRTAAAELPHVDASGPTVVVHSWGGRVEQALAEGRVAGATALLSQRPGELVRRLDHLLRTAEGDERAGSEQVGGKQAGDEPAGEAVLRALAGAVARVSPAVLLSALGEVRTRAGRGPATRVFFPKGGTAKVHLLAEQRAPLPTAVVQRAVAVLTGEVLRRAGTAAPVRLAVLDTALDPVTVPFTQRTASRALVSLPRGSELAVPQGRTLRLFLHWMESDTSGRVDLDLSLAMFDAQWNHIGTCDYTNLRYQDAAVHSGDLTSAPPPLGATEFADVDLERLADVGARYVVAVAFSFNNVAFEDLAEGFVGLMLRDQPGDVGPVFEPRAVEQRFDLSGRARATVPLVIDTGTCTMRWLDVVQGVTGSAHSVGKHSDQLALLGRSLTGLFASGSRIGLGELAVWQAAARADTVLLRHPDGSSQTYRRHPDETVPAFATRIGSPDDDPADPAATVLPELAYLLRGDLELAKDAEVFALYPGTLDPSVHRLLTADDLVTALAADGA